MVWDLGSKAEFAYRSGLPAKTTAIQHTMKSHHPHIVIDLDRPYNDSNYSPDSGRRSTMHFAWDTTTVINLILCIIILVFGIIGWQRSKKLFPLYIGIAFGLFGLSHLATLLSVNSALATVLIIIRLLAYLLVTYTVYLMAFRNK
jgi:hypothetical protein